jgi:hypothetical protein
MVVAFICCLIDRAFYLKIFIVAAISAIIANVIRCSVLLAWSAKGWSNYDMVHDLGGIAIVVCAFLVIISTPRKKRSA